MVEGSKFWHERVGKSSVEGEHCVWNRGHFIIWWKAHFHCLEILWRKCEREWIEFACEHAFFRDSNRNVCVSCGLSSLLLSLQNTCKTMSRLWQNLIDLFPCWHEFAKYCLWWHPKPMLWSPPSALSNGDSTEDNLLVELVYLSLRTC